MDVVTSPIRRFDPARLRARREAMGLSRAAVAQQCGVSERLIYSYEHGERSPSPERLVRLAVVLDCEIAALSGVRYGQETLVDLRYAAGLTVVELAAALRRTALRCDLRVSAATLSELETGRPVRDRRWRDPGEIGQLLVPLAKAFGVPVRMVLDAWMRSRPGEPAPIVPRPVSRPPSRASLAMWASLNARQQLFLAEIMRDDRMTETEMWMRRLQHLPVPPPREWRKLPLALDTQSASVGYTRLQERLRSLGIHDPGVGSTVYALERRGLVAVSEDVVQHPVAGSVRRVRVEMTRLGRAAARAGVGEPREPDPAPHLVSEWLWGVLVRVAGAEPNGLAEDELAGRSVFYLGVGYRGRSGSQPSRGFVDLVPVVAAGGTHVAEYRWRLTDLGRQHVNEYLTTYRTLYPSVDTAGLEALVDSPHR
ncbi:helix-turn-helix domain-containing protein [Nocardia cyriacigeorgica]|uniref:helix-turn-helix domain-containing protein n=1 Tax=Nocardia cyriacigeorgica TaxID=135487 RepID=UPI002491334D|nr:helix-turn-helix transcriptional regulator [Nocardia cyriacigeorgica]